MNWKTKTIVYYGLGGLAIGVLAAVMAINNAEKNRKETDLSLKTSGKLVMAAMDAVRKNVLK